MLKRIVAPLSIATAVALLGITASRAADWLELPAYKSALAPKSLLLASAAAGPRWIAVGERGIVVWSDDAGASWTQAEVPVSVTLTGVSFPTPELGWAVGHDGVILHSQDGGKSWAKQFDGGQANALLLAEAEAQLERVKAAVGEASDETQRLQLEAAEFALEDATAAGEFGPSRPLLGVKFVDGQQGYAVGAFGLLLHTADGGRTWDSWTTRLDNPSRLHCNQITVTADGGLLIASEAGTLFRSSDRGASFQTLNVGYDGALYGALSLQDGRVLLAYGFAGNVFRSEDNGASWQKLEPLSRKSLVAGLLRADGTPLLLSQDRQLLHGDAAAQTFTRIEVPGGGPVASMTESPATGQAVLIGFGGTTPVKLP